MNISIFQMKAVRPREITGPTQGLKASDKDFDNWLTVPFPSFLFFQSPLNPFALLSLAAPTLWTSQNLEQNQTPRADPSFQFICRILWLWKNSCSMSEKQAASSGGKNLDFGARKICFKSPAHSLPSFEALGKLQKHLNLRFFIFKMG